MNRRAIIGWTFYDFADTAFSALFITFFFPIWIRQFLGGTEFHVGLAIGLSLFATALIVPFVGALSDASGRRMPILFVSTVLTVFVTATTGYVGLAAALALGFLANLFNAIDVDLYNAYLPDLAPPSKRGWLSGLGTAVGYLGTVGSLFVAYIVLSFLGFETKEGVQAMFPTTAIFYFVFAIPMFIWVKQKKVKTRAFGASFKKAYGEIRKTVTNLHRTPNLSWFLLASFLYSDAVHTAIIFLSLFGIQRIGLSIQEFFFVFAAMAIASFFGSLLFGKLSDKWGPRKTLILILSIWLALVLVLIVSKHPLVFLIVGSIGGAALGGVWTCNRHMISILAPPEKTAEIFGFGGLTVKFGGVIGPIGYGWLATRFNEEAGLIFLFFFLLFALSILVKLVRAQKVTYSAPLRA